MRLSAVLNEFIYECRIKRFTELTIKGYHNGNALLIKWLNEQFEITNIEDVKPVHLKGYIYSKVDLKCKETYINGIIKQMRAFFKYATANDYIAQNPALKVNWAKEGKPMIKTFTDLEAKRLTEAYANTSFLETRNRTILVMLLDTGIRCNELCILQLNSISDNVLTILGKGNKVRQVGISPFMQKQLTIYLRTRKSYTADKKQSDHLFISRTCRPCTVGAIENIVRTAGQRINLNDDIRCSPHTCRHFFAQNLVRNGIDVYSLSRILGHENISITQRYLDSMLDEDIVKRCAATSPLMNI